MTSALRIRTCRLQCCALILLHLASVFLDVVMPSSFVLQGWVISLAPLLSSLSALCSIAWCFRRKAEEQSPPYVRLLVMALASAVHVVYVTHSLHVLTLSIARGGVRGTLSLR